MTADTPTPALRVNSLLLPLAAMAWISSRVALVTATGRPLPIMSAVAWTGEAVPSATVHTTSAAAVPVRNHRILDMVVNSSLDCSLAPGRRNEKYRSLDWILNGRRRH